MIPFNYRAQTATAEMAERLKAALGYRDVVPYFDTQRGRPTYLGLRGGERADLIATFVFGGEAK